MQEDENTSLGKMDAVDVLNAFIEKECNISIGQGVFVRKDEFAHRYAQYCKQLEVELPSPGTLGNILTICYRMIWSDTVRGDGGEIAVWRNLTFKNQDLGVGQT